MSLHRSLCSSKTSSQHRNVLRKIERIAKLREQNRYQEGAIFNLPKVRSIKVVVKKKKKKEDVAAAAAGAAEAPASATTGETNAKA